MSTTTMHSGSVASAETVRIERRSAGSELAGYQIRRLALGAAVLSWGGIFLLFKLA